ncbi:hypothetical protein HMPREF1549_03219 [Actinomyces johnsonii F0510]|uniref:Uncharacterized protein n=1 Tax=Actinomyces johnsonii F0510 TaxID=1227262 RepID=U1RAK7_9ACTO|nr:hypothetical protein HMPREF1549_03219 [Actinomyces johnsonii F0510]
MYCCGGLLPEEALRQKATAGFTVPQRKRDEYWQTAMSGGENEDQV